MPPKYAPAPSIHSCRSYHTDPSIRSCSRERLSCWAIFKPRLIVGLTQSNPTPSIDPYRSFLTDPSLPILPYRSFHTDPSIRSCSRERLSCWANFKPRLIGGLTQSNPTPSIDPYRSSLTDPSYRSFIPILHTDPSYRSLDTGPFVVPVLFKIDVGRDPFTGIVQSTLLKPVRCCLSMI